MALTEDLKIIKSPNAPQGRPGVAWVNPYGSKTRTYNILEKRLEEKYWPTVNLWESAGYVQANVTRADLLGVVEYSEDEHGNLLAYSSVFNSETGGYANRVVSSPTDPGADWQSREAGLSYTTRGDMPRAALSLGGRNDSGDSEKVSLELVKRIEADPAYDGVPYEAYLQYNDDENMVYKVLNSHDIPDWKELLRAADLENYVKREVIEDVSTSMYYRGRIDNALDARGMWADTYFRYKVADHRYIEEASFNTYNGDHFATTRFEWDPMPYESTNGSMQFENKMHLVSGNYDKYAPDKYDSPYILFDVFEKATVAPFNSVKRIRLGLDVKNSRVYFAQGGSDWNIPESDYKTILHEGNYSEFAVPKTLETSTVLAKIFNENDGGAVQVTNKTTGNVMACAVNSDGSSGGANDLVELYAKDVSGVGSRLFLTPGNAGNAFLSLGDASADRKRLLTEIDGEGYVPAESYRPKDYDWDATGTVSNINGMASVGNTVKGFTQDGGLKYVVSSFCVSDYGDMIVSSQNIEDSAFIHSEAALHTVAGYKEDDGTVTYPMAYLQARNDFNRTDYEGVILGLDLKNKEAYVGFDLENPRNGHAILHKGNYANYAVQKRVNFTNPTFGASASNVANNGAEGITLSVDEGVKRAGLVSLKYGYGVLQEHAYEGGNSKYGKEADSAVTVYAGTTDGYPDPALTLHVHGTAMDDQRTSLDMWLDMDNQRVCIAGSDGIGKEVLHSGNFMDFAAPAVNFSTQWQKTGQKWIDGRDILFVTFETTMPSGIGASPQDTGGRLPVGALVLNSWVIDRSLGPCVASVYGAQSSDNTSLFVYGNAISGSSTEYTFVVWFVNAL
jgi:hypothetical protein